MNEKILNKRYRIVRKLGQGGMGNVYLAMDLDTQRDVAVKTLIEGRVIDKTVIARFRSEAEILKKLRHINIVEFHDYFTEHHNHYIVMEYVSGGSVNALLHNHGPLDSRRVCEIGLSVVSALTAAHDLGIVHRDLKPSNILLAADGTVRLTDFGVARFKADSPLSNTRERTAIGVFPGTITYMSPESLTYGMSPDELCDIWSLGIVFYELLCGKPPFNGPDNRETATLIREAPLPSLRNVVPGLWPALEMILEKMLAKNPAERFQSMRRVGAELDEAMRMEGVVTPSMAMKDVLKRAVSGSWATDRDDADPTQSATGATLSSLPENDVGPYNITYTTSRALILAPGAYQDRNIPPTEKASVGARTVGQLLHDQFQFEVQIQAGPDATLQSVRRALADLQKSGPDDRLVIYWAGAARTRTDRYGQEMCFLAVHDTAWDDWSTFITIDDLVDVRLQPAKHVFFIMDAPTKGPLDITRPNGEELFPTVALSHAGLHLLTAGPNQVPADRSYTHFARSLFDALQGQAAVEGLLSADMVSRYTAQQVMFHTDGEEKPVYGRLRGGERGCFLFQVPLMAYLPRELILGVRSASPIMRNGMIGVLRDFALQSRDEVHRAAVDQLVRLARNDPTQSVKDAARRVLSELLDSGDSDPGILGNSG